jgi:hypothetical protein
MSAWHGMTHTALYLLQATPAAEPWNLWTWIRTFVNTPAPYSPFSEYLALLFVLWLLARRAQREKPDLARQAQHVLDTKHQAGEISTDAYHRFRQDSDSRPR